MLFLIFMSRGEVGADVTATWFGSSYIPVTDGLAALPAKVLSCHSHDGCIHPLSHRKKDILAGLSLAAPVTTWVPNHHHSATHTRFQPNRHPHVSLQCALPSAHHASLEVMQMI